MVKISLNKPKFVFHYHSQPIIEPEAIRGSVERANYEENWMQAHSQSSLPSINHNELTSLTALIAYVASKTGSTEFRVERNLADRFNVANVKFLPSENYDAAICYLVEQIDQPEKTA